MPSPNYDENVFINCPFDSEYLPIFRAIVFVVHDCGYIARCALETGDSSQVRIRKIFQIIEESKFGVHDISRTELDDSFGLPRFNMPLELGIFLGAKRYGGGEHEEKLCLILDRERYRFQKFCSDIAGQDISSHKVDPKLAIREVRNWLKNANPGVRIPSGSRIVERYKRFSKEIPLYCDPLDLDIDDLIYNDFTTLVEVWLRENSW